MTNFAIGTMSLPKKSDTAMEAKAKIKETSCHRLSTNKKRLSFLAMLIIAFCCYGFGLNSQIDTSDNRRIFLENIGIDKVTVLPTDFDAVQEDDLILTLDQRNKLLNGVMSRQAIDDLDYTIYLCAIRSVSDSIVVVQFCSSYSDMESVYIATYSNNAILKDAIFAGHSWVLGYAETIDNDTEQIYETVKTCEFMSPNEFTLTVKYREILKSYNLPKETERCSKVKTTQYEVHEDGKICKISEQSDERLGNEPDSCAWSLGIEEVSKEEFVNAYKNSASYNLIKNSITDTRLNTELINCAMNTCKSQSIIYENETFESLHDTYVDIYSYSIITENGDTIYAVQFTDPVCSYSCVLHNENGIWRGDSVIVDTETVAFSKEGMIAGAQGFDCDDYALIHFYKMLDTSSGKRLQRIISYSNAELKDAGNLDATWAVSTNKNACMFWSDKLNTLYVEGYRVISMAPIYFKIELHARKPDNPITKEEKR